MSFISRILENVGTLLILRVGGEGKDEGELPMTKANLTVLLSCKLHALTITSLDSPKGLSLSVAYKTV